MNPSAAGSGDFPAVMTLSELAAWIGVPVQTLYDLRSQGRGPRAFRVGSQLRVRGDEARAWLACLEEADERRHGGER